MLLDEQYSKAQDGMKTIDVVIGTRPEAIKMAPVIKALSNRKWASVRVVLTGQHSKLLDDALSSLGITPDVNLKVMTHNQTLEALTARLITALDDFWRDNLPSIVLGQGDTTTVFTAGLSAFYKRIPFGHVEAGLRSGNLDSPFPEEMNRLLAARLATLHFAPTARAVQALLDEGLPPDTIFLTGNTVIDTLKSTVEDPSFQHTDQGQVRRILLTTHRRENFGGPMAGVLRALREVIEDRPDVEILFPAHPNPAVRAAAAEAFGHHPRVRIIEPLDYRAFVRALAEAYLIVTDSGGVQEEAPFLRKPVVVIRKETERPEALAHGVARLVGTDPGHLRATINELFDEPAAYQAMTSGASPYGDGYASERIAALVGHHLGEIPSSAIPEMFRSGAPSRHRMAYI